MSKLESFNKFNKIFKIIENFYVYLFFFYAMLGSINITHGSKIITPVMWLSFIVGFCIIVYRVFHYKKYYKMPALAALTLLLFSICLSTVLNYSYSFKENFILCIYWAIFFFVIYTRNEDKTSEEIKKDTELFLKIFICYMTIAVLVSFVLFAVGISGTIIVPNTGDEIYIGFMIGRLWGVFLNPNSGAILSMLTSVMLTYFIIQTNKKWIKAVCVIDIFCMFMYIALSDSRTGAVCNGIIFGVFFLCLFIYKTREKKIWVKILSVFLSFVIMFAGFFIPRQLKNLYNEGIKLTSTLFQENEENNNGDFSDALIERGYDLSDDISNRRFDAWGGAIELFLDSPQTIIYGCSFRGFTEYAKNHQPDNYLINNDSSDFTTLDNEFFNILTANGLIGVAAALFLIVSVITFIIKNYFKVKEQYQLITVLGITSAIGLSAASMLNSVIFYNFSPFTIAFWFILGSTMMILKNSKEVKNK